LFPNLQPKQAGTVVVVIVW